MIAKRLQNRYQNRVYVSTDETAYTEEMSDKQMKKSMDEIKKRRHFLIPHIIILKIRGISDRDLQIVSTYLLRFNVWVEFLFKRGHAIQRLTKSKGRNTQREALLWRTCGSLNQPSSSMVSVNSTKYVGIIILLAGSQVQRWSFSILESFELD